MGVSNSTLLRYSVEAEPSSSETQTGIYRNAHHPDGTIDKLLYETVNNWYEKIFLYIKVIFFKMILFKMRFLSFSKCFFFFCLVGICFR